MLYFGHVIMLSNLTFFHDHSLDTSSCSVRKVLRDGIEPFDHVIASVRLVFNIWASASQRC